MSRKYSIGFFIGILLVIVLFVIGFKMSYNHMYENQIDELEIEEGYYVKDKDGYLTVYLSNGSVYEYTSISTAQLPETIQEGLDFGIHLENLAEVYGFLENYSS